MTMELLMNKRKYNKYISKNDPEKYSQRQEEFSRIQKYATRILSLTEDLLNDPDTEVPSDIHQSFLDYVKTCMYHFETKDREFAGCYEGDNDNNDKEDTMFGECNNDESARQALQEVNSYWGKRIHKVSGSRVDAYFSKASSIK